MDVWCVRLWGARAKQAVIMPMPSFTLPRRPTYFLTASHSATACGLSYSRGKQSVHS
jgi:hypothetical protein